MVGATWVGLLTARKMWVQVVSEFTDLLCSATKTVFARLAECSFERTSEAQLRTPTPPPTVTFKD
jgi:hypothetical protein